MRNDYNKKIENLQRRRYDDTLSKAILSESFTGTSYGQATKYALEAMKEIDQNYTKNTYLASEKFRSTCSG